MGQRTIGGMRGRTGAFGVLLSSALGLVLLAAIPALAKGVPYLIDVESYNPAPAVGEPTTIVITLYDVTDPTRRLEEEPLMADLEPIEIREVDGTGVRTPTFERVDTASFQAEVTYPRTGEWRIVIHPGFTVREVIPTDYPLELMVEVTPPPPATTSGDWEGVAASLGFVALLVVIAVGVGRSRWRRGTPAAPDNPGDTWWSGG